MIVCGVFIHWEADDDKKIYQFNYEATKLAIARAMTSEPTPKEITGKEGNRQASVFGRLKTSKLEATPGSTARAMRRILIQFDTDAVPSVFDRVVAVDAGIDELFSYGGVNARPRGAARARGHLHPCPADLKQTAIYIGGSDVGARQRLFDKVTGTFFGPLRVSVMIDSNGSNTTAAAAVLAARKARQPAGSHGPGAGGHRSGGRSRAQLLVREGAKCAVGFSLARTGAGDGRLGGVVRVRRCTCRACRPPRHPTSRRLVPAWRSSSRQRQRARLLTAEQRRAIPDAQSGHRSQRGSAGGHRGDRSHRQSRGARWCDLLRCHRRRRHQDEDRTKRASPSCSRPTTSCWTPSRSTRPGRRCRAPNDNARANDEARMTKRL